MTDRLRFAEETVFGVNPSSDQQDHGLLARNGPICGLDLAAPGEERTVFAFVGYVHGSLVTQLETLQYNEGPSEWLQGHAIVYPDGPMEVLPMYPIVRDGEGPLTQVCDECDRRMYACRRVQRAEHGLTEVPNNQGGDAFWVCPPCYPILRKATGGPKNREGNPNQ